MKKICSAWTTQNGKVIVVGNTFIDYVSRKEMVSFSFKDAKEVEFFVMDTENFDQEFTELV